MSRSEVARSPEDLATLLEDAFVCGDPTAVSALFAPDGLLAANGERARGHQRISVLAQDLLTARRVYVAGRPQVVQVQDTSLILGQDAVGVARCDLERRWTYLMAVIRP